MSAHCLVVIDAFAAAYAFNNYAPFVLTIRWNEKVSPVRNTAAQRWKPGSGFIDGMRETHSRLYNRQQVHGAMINFASKERDVFFLLLAR